MTKVQSTSMYLHNNAARNNQHNICYGYHCVRRVSLSALHCGHHGRLALWFMVRVTARVCNVDATGDAHRMGCSNIQCEFDILR